VSKGTLKIRTPHSASLRTPQFAIRTVLASPCPWMYGECMARKISTTVRLDEEDVRALKRARAAGHSASELVRKGLRIVASRYYGGRRPPSTRLFESTSSKLGDETELFRDVEG
jgi:Arc/MetJ-type ribon-helix-helix transcriptional regulator